MADMKLKPPGARYFVTEEQSTTVPAISTRILRSATKNQRSGKDSGRDRCSMPIDWDLGDSSTRRNSEQDAPSLSTDTMITKLASSTDPDSDDTCRWRTFRSEILESYHRQSAQSTMSRPMIPTSKLPAPLIPNSVVFTASSWAPESDVRRVPLHNFLSAENTA